MACIRNTYNVIIFYDRNDGLYSKKQKSETRRNTVAALICALFVVVVLVFFSVLVMWFPTFTGVFNDTNNNLPKYGFPLLDQIYN